MDELGSNVADRTSDDDTSEMSGPVASATADLRKRRSTRIVQAVPLALSGVDALGRPFTERTSSLIINCHGCRYQSKHYVLKNMWVTVEVPHPETGQPPRSVRGRVAWIQRPKTVRQLFQVALELEIPGNVWGIGFPPEDWFAFPDGEQARAAAAAASAGGRLELPSSAHTSPEHSSHETTLESEFHLPLSDEEPPSGGGAGNLRAFPAPGSTTDASLQLARQMTRLLAEARQQIQAAAREAAAQAVSAERRISAEAWEQRVSASYEQLSRELAAAIEKIEEENTARSRVAQEAAGEALQRDLTRLIAPQLEELTRDLTAQLSQEAVALRNAQSEKLAKVPEGLRDVCREAEELTARLREASAQLESQAARCTEAGIHRIEETAREQDRNLVARQHALTAETVETEKRLNAALESAQVRWQDYLNGEMEATQARGQIAIDNALAEAQSRAANSLGEQTNVLLATFQQEAERLAASFREAATASTGETVWQLTQLNDSAKVQTERLESAVTRADEAGGRLENFAERIDATREQALHNFQSQIDDVLSLHRNELHRRSDSLFDEMNARIRATFEDSAQQAVAQFQQQAQSIVQPDLVKVDEAIHRLAGGRSMLEAVTSLQQERIRTTADEAFAEALAQFRGNLAGVEQLLRDSADAVVAKSLADLEARAESAKHQAVDDLLKSAEWYEKKAQTQMQHLAEKAGEQAALQLREKAAEISGAFAGELNHASHNFVSHAQTQMENVVRDSFERARALFSDAAETTSAAFIDEIQKQARQELGGFEAEVHKSASDTRSQMEAARADLEQKVSAEQESFLRRFQSAMKGEMENGVLEMNQRVQSGFGPLLDAWKSMAEGQQAEMRGICGKVRDEAVEGYRSHLENISKQWMLATVASLDHQSRDVVSAISATAEEKLRDTCTKVFSDMGEALRERLRQIAANFAASAPRHSN
jgi:hypothetical protein